MSKQYFYLSDHIKVIVIVINVPILDSAEVGSDSIKIRSEFGCCCFCFSYLFIVFTTFSSCLILMQYI